MNTVSPHEMAPIAPSQTETRRVRIAVYLACALISVATNFFLGKDMSWDMLNYHVYAGFSALHDRFAQDYFAAGPQSYFNPYAFVPFYLLAWSGLPALAVGAILAIAHSAILCLTFELAMLVLPSRDLRVRVTIGVCAIALAFANPVLMQQLGSTFADITTAELVLAGWVLLTSAVRSPHAGRIMCAGALLGVATALKLTNAVHAISACAILLWIPAPIFKKIRQGAFFAVSIGLGFTVVAAPWSYRLEAMFGNPFFPLLNNVFKSPEFTTGTLRQFRFIPSSIWEALWRPFAMLDPVRMVHEELSAPDPRYAVLLVVCIALLSRWLWRRWSHSATPRSSSNEIPASYPLAALGCGLAVDWTLWLSASGNSRYFLAMACVTSVIVVVLLFESLKDRPKARNYVIAGVFLSQAVQLSMGAEFRWTGVPWTRTSWFNIEMPMQLATERNLYLTIGMQSNSFLAPFLAPASGLINFSGSYTPLESDDANGARVKELLYQFQPNTRMLIRGARLYRDDEGRTPRRSQVDDALRRFGLRVVVDDCAAIAVRGLPPELPLGFDANKGGESTHSDTTYLVSCRVQTDTTDRSAEIARQHSVDLVLDRLEDACPEVLQPKRASTEHEDGSWHRRYMNTDVKAYISNGAVKIRDPLRGDALIFSERESDWSGALPRLQCGRDMNGYWAKRPP